MSLIQGLLRINFLRAWIFLELSTLSFLYYIFCDEKKKLFKERIKLFLIQALRGLIILIIIIQIEIFGSKILFFFLTLIIILKIAAAPFHRWFLRIVNQISWDRLFIFLTTIKFIPLILLSNINIIFFEVFRVISFRVAALRRYYYRTLKCLVLLSSLFFLGILYILLQTFELWVDLLITYSLIFLILILYFTKFNEDLRRTPIHTSGSIITLMNFLLLVNLAGLPPFPGFFLKVLWLIEAEGTIFLFSRFIISSRLIIFIYLSFSLKNLREINRSFLKISNVKFSRVAFTIRTIFFRLSPLLFRFN